MIDAKPMKNLMHTSTLLDKDKNGKKVHQTIYRGMIGSLFT